MRIWREEQAAGERLPPWWYGLAYVEWERDVAVWYPLPLNYVARWWRLVRWRWDWWRSRAPRLDRRIRRLVHGAYARGYHDGQEAIARQLVAQGGVRIPVPKPPLGPRPW